MSTWFRRLFARSDKNQPEVASGLVCKEVVELITAYLEDSLLPEKKAELEEHLAACDGCTNYLEQVRLTLNMLRNLTKEPVFPGTKAELLQVFQQWSKKS
jgi:predicted anti-sigma-YlaC factor YlaD